MTTIIYGSPHGIEHRLIYGSPIIALPKETQAILWGGGAEIDLINASGAVFARLVYAAGCKDLRPKAPEHKPPPRKKRRTFAKWFGKRKRARVSK